MRHMTMLGSYRTTFLSSTTINDLLKSIKLLERAGIQPTTAATQAPGSTPVCPVHQRPMKASRRPGSFYCSAKVGDGYCQENVRL